MLDKYPVRAADVAYRIIEGEAILVSAKNGRIYTLNPIGARIWEMANGTTMVPEMVASICEVFEVEEEQAHADSIEFLQSLIDRGILTLSDGQEIAR